MREKNVARKRRLTILRQLTSEETEPGPDVARTDQVNYAGDIQSFATACDARLPLRIRVTDERSGESEETLVDRPFAIIGTSELCDVRMVHPDLSRHHAYIQILGGRVLCCDLGSRTGTHWGTEIRSRSWMDPGVPAYMGPYSVRLVENEFVDPPSDEMPVFDPGGGAMFGQTNMLLTFLNARSRSGQTRITRVRNPITLVGWSHLCNLRLQHRSAGRVHGSLVWTSSGLWVVDLMCRGGTRVNGELVNFTRLDDEDELEIGRFQMKIAYGSAGEMSVFSPADAPEASPIADLSRGPVDEMALEETLPPTRRSRRSASTKNAPQEEPLLTRVAPAPRSELADVRSTMPAVAQPMPTELTGATANETFAMTMMQQFAVMQQQMFDHTYQLLAVVTEAFQTAHNNQLQLIREELMRVHELNRELHDLNRQRGTVDSEASHFAAANGTGASTMDFVELQRRLLAEPGQEPAAAAAVTMAAAASIPVPPPAPSVVPPAPAVAAAPGPSGAPPAAPRPNQPVSLPDRAPPESRPDEPRPPEPAPEKLHPLRRPAAAAATAAPGATDGADMHAWLSSRISELTTERSSRWQKILQMLTSGKGGG